MSKFMPFVVRLTTFNAVYYQRHVVLVRLNIPTSILNYSAHQEDQLVKRGPKASGSSYGSARFNCVQGISQKCNIDKTFRLQFVACAYVYSIAATDTSSLIKKIVFSFSLHRVFIIVLACDLFFIMSRCLQFNFDFHYYIIYLKILAKMLSKLHIL